MSLLGGRLCEVAYTNPILPSFKFFHSNQGEGGGHGLLYPLAMPVPQLAFVNLGSKRGSEATEWGGGGGGGGECVSPSHGREFFLKIRV